MAQFTMNAQIILKAQDANKSIDKFKKNTKKAKTEFSLFGRVIALDTARMRKGLMGATAIVGGLYAGILAQSPDVRAEFKKLGAEIFLLNVGLGKELQPALAMVVEGLTYLIRAFLELPPNIQAVVAITIFLTTILVFATVAAMALWAALGPISIAILLLAAAFAILFVYRKDIEDFGNAVLDAGVKMTSALYDGIDAIDRSIENFFSKFGIFGDIIGTFVRLIVRLFLIIPVASDDAFATVIQMIGEFIAGIGKLFQGDIPGFVDSMLNMLIRPLNFFIRLINAFLIDPLNMVIELFDKIAKKFGGGISFRIPDIPEISTFQEGGDMMRDGIIFAHRDETIMRKSEARQIRAERGGGGRSAVVNNYNTFNVGSVDSRSRVLEIAKEVDKMNKRSADRRFKL